MELVVSPVKAGGWGAALALVDSDIVAVAGVKLVADTVVQYLVSPPARERGRAAGTLKSQAETATYLPLCVDPGLVGREDTDHRSCGQ